MSDPSRPVVSHYRDKDAEIAALRAQLRATHTPGHWQDELAVAGVDWWRIEASRRHHDNGQSYRWEWIDDNGRSGHGTVDSDLDGTFAAMTASATGDAS